MHPGRVTTHSWNQEEAGAHSGVPHAEAQCGDLAVLLRNAPYER